MPLIRLRRPRALRVALIAALALLIAQIGAVRHVYAHGAEGGTVAALKQQLPGVHELCGDCLNYAPLLATAGTTGSIHFEASPARPLLAERGAANPARAGPFLAFRSRAPPATH